VTIKPDTLMRAPEPRLLWLGGVLALAAILGAPSAHAAGLSCGTLNPHAQISAFSQGQSLAQSTDLSDHPLPWSHDLTNSSGQSNAHKEIDASCQTEGNSVLISISSDEFGYTSANQPNDSARAGWGPTWVDHVFLSGRQQLHISVSSSVNYLNCQLVAPDVAMNWSGTFSDNATTTTGIRDVIVMMSCTSGGLHDITQRVSSGRVNGETILLNLSILDDVNATRPK